MKKSQYATEYLLIVGIGLIILIPSIALFYNYSMEQSDEAIISRVNSIGRSIVSNAETVFYMGEPSRRTIEHEFPNKIYNISIESDGNNYFELRFTVGDRRNIFPFPSNVPIDGPFYRNRTGLMCNDTDVNRACYSSGKKNVVLEARDDSVRIIIR